jgi:hypothetical protein
MLPHAIEQTPDEAQGLSSPLQPSHPPGIGMSVLATTILALMSAA